jgi:hypothetical protein
VHQNPLQCGLNRSRDISTACTEDLAPIPEAPVEPIESQLAPDAVAETTIKEF